MKYKIKIMVERLLITDCSIGTVWPGAFMTSFQLSIGYRGNVKHMLIFNAHAIA